MTVQFRGMTNPVVNSNQSVSAFLQNVNSSTSNNNISSSQPTSLSTTCSTPSGCGRNLNISA